MHAYNITLLIFIFYTSLFILLESSVQIHICISEKVRDGWAAVGWGFGASVLTTIPPPTAGIHWVSGLVDLDEPVPLPGVDQGGDQLDRGEQLVLVTPDGDDQLVAVELRPVDLQAPRLAAQADLEVLREDHDLVQVGLAAVEAERVLGALTLRDHQLEGHIPIL